MTTTATAPRMVSGGDHEHGHLEELRTDPIGLLRFSMGQAKKVQAARGRELARRFAA